MPTAKHLTRWVLLLFCFVVPQIVMAAKKKVLILDFLNSENLPEYKYLEASITEAVQASLKKRFVFEETPRASWQALAEKNYMYKEDNFTKSVTMNLGLLAKQDVVIAGKFRIDKSTEPATVITEVRIVDVAGRKQVASFTENGPAGSGIFNTINKIAQRIALESKSVLPSPEEWARTQLTETKKDPWFRNWGVGARAGAGFYALGYADRIAASQPLLGLSARVDLPKLWPGLVTQFEFNYFTHSPIEGKNPAIAGLALNTANYVLGQYLGLEYDQLPYVTVMPKIGFGYVLQNTSVSGAATTSLNNSFIFVGAGVDVLYGFGEYYQGVLGLQILTEFESGNVTLHNSIALGINYFFESQ